MAIVITFHTLLYVLVREDGSVTVVPWAPGPVLWGLSWLFSIIPVFFMASGYANTVIVDRLAGQRHSGYLAGRVRRLIGPVTLFAVVFTLAGTVAAWSGFLPEALALSPRFAQLYWFLVIYLLLLAAAPALVAAHDRFGGWAMVPFVLAAVLVDVAARGSGIFELQWLNLLFVWPLAHQWGIAYRRGWFAGWRTGPLLGGVAASGLVIVGLVFGLGYPPAAVAWADVLVANMQPPTVAAVAMGFGQVCLLGLLDRLGVARTLSARTARVVAVANALVLTGYFWHIPLIVVAAGLLVGLASTVPAVAGVAVSAGSWLVVTWVLVLLLLPWIARLEQRLSPRAGVVDSAADKAKWPVFAGFALLVAGLFGQWQFGAVLHPQAPGAIAATSVLFGGIVLLRRGVRLAG